MTIKITAKRCSAEIILKKLAALAIAASHQSNTGAQVEFATRAVVENNFIRPREVVVTKDQPLGIWHLEGVELAPLIQRWQLGESWPNILSTYEAGLKAKLYYWLEQQGLTASAP